MSALKTGATEKQLDDAINERIKWVLATDDPSKIGARQYAFYKSQMRACAPHLVPEDCVIVPRVLIDAMELWADGGGSQELSREYDTWKAGNNGR